MAKFKIKIEAAFIFNRCLDVSGLNLDSRRRTKTVPTLHRAKSTKQESACFRQEGK